MITINRYTRLPLQMKADLLWSTGEYLAEKKKGAFKVKLYDLNCFYVEVYYYNHIDDIAKIEAFKNNNEKLESYLDSIDISELYHYC